MIEGEKIFLRALEPSDVDLIFAWENNQQNWLNSHTQRPFSRNSIEEYVFSAKDIYTDKQLRLMVTKYMDHLGNLILEDGRLMLTVEKI